MAKFIPPNFIVDSSASFLKQVTFDTSTYFHGRASFDTSIYVNSIPIGTMAFKNADDYYTSTEVDTIISNINTSLSGSISNLEASIARIDVSLNDTIEITDIIDASLAVKVDKAGDTMTGQLVFASTGFSLDGTVINTIDTSVGGLSDSSTAITTSGLIKSYVDTQISQVVTGSIIQNSGTDMTLRPKINFIGFNVEDDAANEATKITNPLGSYSNRIYVSDNGNDTTGNGSFVKPYANISKALTESNDIVVATGSTTDESDVITIADTSGLIAGMQIKGAGIPTGSIISSVTENTSITISNGATATASDISLYCLDATLIVVSGKHTVDYNCWKDGISFLFEQGCYIDKVSGSPTSHYLFSNEDSFYYGINVYGKLKLRSFSSFFRYNNTYRALLDCYNTIEFEEVHCESYGMTMGCANNSNIVYTNIKGDIYSNTNNAVFSSNYVAVNIESNVLYSRDAEAIKLYNTGGSSLSTKFNVANTSGGGTYAADFSTAVYGSVSADLGIVNNDIRAYANHNASLRLHAVNINKTMYVTGQAANTGSVVFTGLMKIEWQNSVGTAYHSGDATISGGRVRLTAISKYTASNSRVTVSGGVAVIDEIVAASDEYITVTGGKAILNNRIKCNAINGHPVNISGGEVFIYGEVDCINLNPLRNPIAIYQTGGTVYLYNGGRVISRQDKVNAAGIYSTAGTIIINGGEILNDYPAKALDVRFPYGSTSNIKILSGGLTSKRDDVLTGQQKEWLLTVDSVATTGCTITDIDGGVTVSVSTGSTVAEVATALANAITALGKNCSVTDNGDGTVSVLSTDATTFYPINISSLVNLTTEVVKYESIPKDNDIDDLTLYKGGVLNKYNATTAPTAGDDSGDGYEVGSFWVDVTNDDVYICADASSGAAVWLQINNAGHTIEDTGTPMTQREKLNFIGFTVEDDAVNNVTKIINPVVGDGRTIYVAEYGDDTTGDGTLGLPYKTLSKASTEAVPLDTIEGDITSGSATVANVSSADIAKLFVGQQINGTGVPRTTYIASISADSFTMTKNATATTTDLEITIKVGVVVYVKSGRYELSHGLGKDGLDWDIERGAVLTASSNLGNNPVFIASGSMFDFYFRGYAQISSINGHLFSYTNGISFNVYVEFDTIKHDGASYCTCFNFGSPANNYPKIIIKGNSVKTTNYYALYFNSSSAAIPYVEISEIYTANVGTILTYGPVILKASTVTSGMTSGNNVTVASGNVSIGTIVNAAAVKGYVGGGELECSFVNEIEVPVNKLLTFKGVCYTLVNNGGLVRGGIVERLVNNSGNATIQSRSVIRSGYGGGNVVVEGTVRVEYLDFPTLGISWTITGGKLFIDSDFITTSRQSINGGEVHFNGKVTGTVSPYNGGAVVEINNDDAKVYIYKELEQLYDDPRSSAIILQRGTLILNGAIIRTLNETALPIKYRTLYTPTLKIMSAGASFNKENQMAGQTFRLDFTVSSVADTSLRLTYSVGSTGYNCDVSDSSDATVQAIVTALVNAVNTGSHNTALVATDNGDGESFRIEGVDNEVYYLNNSLLVNCTSTIIRIDGEALPNLFSATVIEDEDV